MTYMGDSIAQKDTAVSATDMPQADSTPVGGAPPRFLVNIINKRELALLEELLIQNKVPYVVRNASRKNKRPNAEFSMLGKDIYVDGDHYDRAKAALADYYLGGEQATADTNTVPAARRQQAQAPRGKGYPIKKLVLWLVLATVGYTLLFTLWMHLMK